jgi:hypothetical protein
LSHHCKGVINGKIMNMDANYLHQILESMNIKFEVLYKENLLIDYNSILIVKIIK